MQTVTWMALLALVGLVVWMVAFDPAADAGGELFGESGDAPALAVEERTFDGVAWIGEEPGDPREAGVGMRVVICIDPHSDRSLTWGKRLVEIAERLGDVTPIWLTNSTNRIAAGQFLEDVGGQSPLLLGATRETLERFRLFQAPSLRAFDPDGREIARSLIPLAARARDAQ